MVFVELMTQIKKTQIKKQADILDALFLLIKERRHDDPAKSYTAKMFAGGLALCARKLGEEAVETSVASLAETPERVISESADLLYHWLVLLAAQDIEPERVYRELEKRMKENEKNEKDEEK